IVISLSRLRKRALLLAEEMVEKFSEQQLHFKAISDTANDGIVSADQAGNVSYFNKAAERIFGYTPNEILGRPITELMPSQYRDKHQRGFHQFTQHGQSKLTGTTLELQGQRKDGEVFPLELSLSHWTSSGAHHVNAVMRDISERKKIEKMKSEFISTVSHELRTPLTAIRGALALMGHGNKSGNFNTDEMLPLAQNNIERLSRLIDDLLDVEKLEASQLRLNLHAQPLCELLNGAVGHHRPAAETAGVTISMAGCEDAQVLADTDRLHQIMANLLSNAIKFSPRGTHIEIRTQLLDTHVKISVADQGSGIPDAFRERIFQKFAQADSSDSRAKGGTGLGLSICKMLVERHGGEIGYTTNPGHGTTFYFTLRRATPTEKAVGY
ncbi:MAG: PAS domain-containing sensor histidine kinase, partial [Gammaproteobacteria bacterium]|nr:PAS domain-containing sensor histidine kinase [Gammaproteobacteria bacterium]